MKFFKFNFRKVFIGIAASLAIYLLLAVGLVFTPPPVFEEIPEGRLETPDPGNKPAYPFEQIQFTARDGKKLNANLFEANTKTTIVLIHGVLGNIASFNKTAGLLSAQAAVRVVALDLRGHGLSEGRPGDVDYKNQYVDDINDVIAAIRKERPGEKIILAGYSMGGGIAMRYVQHKKVAPVDGYLLFAPALGYNAPTTPKVFSPDTERFIKVHVPRIIGLAMLNALHISAFNDKSILFFNLPRGTPLAEYTFRSLESTYPEDAAAAFSEVHQPLLLIVGEKDENFIVDQFEPLVRNSSKGAAFVIEGADHDSVHHDLQSIELIKKWIEKEQLAAPAIQAL